LRWCLNAYSQKHLDRLNMNNNTIELINFIQLVYADGVLTEKEAKAVSAKAEALGISQEEAEVILEQFASNPDSIINMVQQHKAATSAVAPSEKSVKKRVSQDIKLSLHHEKINIKADKSYQQLEGLNYDEIYLRTVKKLFKSSKGEKVKQIKEIEKEISNLKKESKLGSDTSQSLEQKKVKRKAIYDSWTTLLSAFVLLWSYFSLIGLKSDWVSILIGIGFSVLVTFLISSFFSGLIDGYINEEISMLDNSVDYLSENNSEIASSIERLNSIKHAVLESLNEQQLFQSLSKNKSKPLELNPFYETGCNEIVRQTEISDGDMQKIITNCLFIKDIIKQKNESLHDYVESQANTELPSAKNFHSIERQVAEINVYMALLNGYCYSIQNLSERTQFEHFLSENLINLSRKDRLQLQGMKKMIGQLTHLNDNISNLSREVMEIKDSLNDFEHTLGMLEYSMDDVRYSVDDIKYDMAESKKSKNK